MNDITFSFIIASSGREGLLQNCLNSIENACGYSRNIKAEMLVVLNGQSNKYDGYKRVFSQQAKIYMIDEVGLSRARNYGIKRSAGEYLIFLDDDAMVKENILDEIMIKINAKSAKALCGRIIDRANNEYFANIFNIDQTKELGLFDYNYFRGSAHIVEKALIGRIGLYDERFGAGARYFGAEESDLFFRLKQANEKIIYSSDIVFYHPITTKSSSLKVFNYSCGVGAMLVKQIINDKTNLFVYSLILLTTITKSFIRSMQNYFFPNSMRSKNEIWHYKQVLDGTITGIFKYVDYEIINGNRLIHEEDAPMKNL